jgi:heptaprenyl diphosphate synthase
MARAKHFLTQYAGQARQELGFLPDVPGRHALATLVEYTVSRHG